MGDAHQRRRGAVGTQVLLFQFLVSHATLPDTSIYAQGSGALPEGVDRLNPKFHTMISTDCSVYSDWQAEVLAYSHFKSGTTGNLTRIASCQDPHYTYPKIWHPEMQLETTPYFGEQTLPTWGVDKYPIYNKPFGINHWLTQGAGSSLPDDTVVVMLDPDMIVQMPLQHAFERNLTGEPVVSAGRPAAHSWQLGYEWYNKWNAEEWLEEECKAAGPGSCRAADRGHRMVTKHYMVGAPHAMTAGDWRALCPLWGRYLLRIREVSKAWMADMNAFILAAMQLGLRHETTTSLQVWSPAKAGEAWHLVSGLDDETGKSKKSAMEPDRFIPFFAYDGKTAPILHYCRTAQLRERTDIGSHDRFSKYGFGKKPAGAADCSPQPAYRYNNERLQEIAKDPGETLKDRKDAYMMRNVAMAVWEGLAHYREAVCDIKAGSAYAALPWKPQVRTGLQPKARLPMEGMAKKEPERQRSQGGRQQLFGIQGSNAPHQALLKRIKQLETIRKSRLVSVSASANANARGGDQNDKELSGAGTTGEGHQRQPRQGRPQVLRAPGSRAGRQAMLNRIQQLRTDRKRRLRGRGVA